MPETLSELGPVTPIATVNVLPQLSGYLTAVGYKEGEDVVKGQFLAQIDPRHADQVGVRAVDRQRRVDPVEHHDDAGERRAPEVPDVRVHGVRLADRQDAAPTWNAPRVRR